MIKLGIVSNLYKDPTGENTSKVIHRIIERNMLPMVTDPVFRLLRQGTYCKEEEELFEHSDIILVLGGDGTILQTSRSAAKYNKPILGVNLGHLGFLAEAEMSNLDSILDIIVSGSYKTEYRMMLESKLIRNGQIIESFLALNDVAVTKGSFARLIHLDVTINGEFVNHYAADGLLVSTPTGSTAYSLSAGGPIIFPGMECLLMTPICPHTLTSRPIVTDANAIIEINVTDKNREVQMTIDGQYAIELHSNDKIIISKSKMKTQLVRLPGYGFFNLLRNKLSARNEC